jgi:hypothetical protein
MSKEIFVHLKVLKIMFSSGSFIDLAFSFSSEIYLRLNFIYKVRDETRFHHHLTGK